MISLDFLNKNMYRKYPLRAECDMTFLDGSVMPQDLITSMQLSTVFGVHKFYITKVYVDEGFISVTINNYDTGLVIGCFAGKVLANFTTIPFTSNVTTVSGTMTTGPKESLRKLSKGAYLFRDEVNDVGVRANSLLEDSTIFCYTPPGVAKITVGNKSVVGKVLLSKGVNSSITSVSSTNTRLNATNPNAIMSNNEFSGSIDNCPTPIIKKINSVFPDEDGNIDIYGITPIVINVETGEISMSSNLDIYDVCPEKKKISPPVDDTDVYYTDITATLIPEWRTWPNFD